jgi:tetratricopeptide (TPR) repeat protein
MRITRHKRQIFLFVIAILLPATVLIGLAGQIIYQERELAIKRAADQRRTALDQLRRELVARLEAIKVQEINELIGAPDVYRMQGSKNPAVAFTAQLEIDRLILWETVGQPNLPVSPEFDRYYREGETQEFLKKDYSAASAAYRLALESARNLSQSAESRLLLARALTKGGKTTEAFRHYRALLTEAAQVRDEQGVGFCFYAAERLLDAKGDPAAVLNFLSASINAERRLTLPELYMLRSLLGSLPETQTGHLQERVAFRIVQMEQAAALAKDFPRLRAQIESSAASGPVWIAYGKDEPWLVSMTPPAPPLPGVLVAVSCDKAVPPGVKLRPRVTGGDVLGEGFPGVSVAWSNDRLTETSRQSALLGLYVAGLTLVIGITVFGGYLLFA